MIEIQCLAIECSYAHKLVIHIVHVTLGVGYRTARYKQTTVVAVGHDLQVSGIHDLYRVAKVRHKV